MSTTPSNSEYLFLFRGTNWQQGLSAEEMQKVLGSFMAWFDRLSAEGILKVGQPLEHEGRIVSGKQGRTVADGPFAESKEAIAGYFLLQADDLDAAVAIAQSCPTLEYGAQVEVRQVADSCPHARQMAHDLAHASV